MVQDYPDGFSRDVPGHTVELESGFSLPWLQSASLTIAAGGNSSFTVNFNDPNWIYYIDMINVTAQAYTEFYIFVEVNGVVYAAAADMGTVIINLRMNPSILSSMEIALRLPFITRILLSARLLFISMALKSLDLLYMVILLLLVGTQVIILLY